jgi:hypothetical protein
MIASSLKQEEESDWTSKEAPTQILRQYVAVVALAGCGEMLSTRRSEISMHEGSATIASDQEERMRRERREKMHTSIWSGRDLNGILGQHKRNPLCRW